MSHCATPTVTLTSPVNGATFGTTQSIVVSGRATGDSFFANGEEFAYGINRVEVYVDGTLLGNATLGAAGVDANDHSWRDYSYTVSPRPAGTHTLSVKAVDTGNSVSTKPQVSVTVANPNASPTVSVTSPGNGSVVTVNVPLSLTVSASDSDGTVASVQYFESNVAISGVLTSAPFTFSWTPTRLGANGIKAVAIDNVGASTTSATNTFTVNDKPTSTFAVSNVNNQNPGSITLTPTAADSVGGVAYIELYVNGSRISSALSSGFATNLTGYGPGTYSLVTRAVDNYNVYTDSAPYAWTVNAAPSATLTTPVNGTVQNSGVPASIALAANASDGDGSITKVEFLANGNVVATKTAPPYTATWNGVGPGSYSVQARATDNAGGITTSAASALTVSTGNQAQFISQSVPAAIVAGQSAAVSVTMKNTGTSTWTATSNHRLGAQNPQDNSTWGMGRVALPQSVAPGATATFSFNVTAPAAVGTYNFQWKMVQDAVEWFGDLGANAAINVAAAPTAAITAPTNGATYPPGLDIPVTVSAEGGSISKVEVYDGSSLIATLTSAPYTATIADAPAGTNPSYAYDANGNMQTDGARSFSWTSFNMPATLTKTAQAGSPGAGTSTFLYGPEHQRLKQTWVDSAKTLTTIYLADPAFEKEVDTQTGITEYKHYVKVGERIVAIQTRRNTGGGTWTTIAEEGETFTVTGTQTVRYGRWDAPWLTKSVTGSGECSSEFFGGDPLPGEHKSCEVSSGGGSEDIKYLIPDHLGSTSVVTDASGAALDRQAYDPWGDRRTASGSSAGAADPTHLIQPTSTDRGFTGHEHLDQGNMGLVHMNGRVYDPTLGRFISADPNIPDPQSTQSFSRFSYVRNSPLNATDPTGFQDSERTLPPRETALSGVETTFCDRCIIHSDGSTSPLPTGAQMAAPGVTNEAAPAGGGSGFPAAPSEKGSGGGGDYAQAEDSGSGAKGDVIAGQKPGVQTTYDPNDVRGGFNERGESLVKHPDHYNPGEAAKVLVLGATLIAPEIAAAVRVTSAVSAAARGLTTGANEAVFWSGLGRGGAESAAAWAAKNGGATLESTLAARGIKLPAWDASNPAVVAAWRRASIDFAAGARGNVRVLQGDFLRSDAIWRAEYSALKANSNVTSIRSVNPSTGAEVLLWAR